SDDAQLQALREQAARVIDDQPCLALVVQRLAAGGRRLVKAFSGGINEKKLALLVGDRRVSAQLAAVDLARGKLHQRGGEAVLFFEQLLDRLAVIFEQSLEQALAQLFGLRRQNGGSQLLGVSGHH